jgi:hypothetical protein
MAERKTVQKVGTGIDPDVSDSGRCHATSHQPLSAVLAGEPVGSGVASR